MNAGGKAGIYPALHIDAAMLDYINIIAADVTDDDCRAALKGGVQNALDALHRRAGGVKISLTGDDHP